MILYDVVSNTRRRPTIEGMRSSIFEPYFEPYMLWPYLSINIVSLGIQFRESFHALRTIVLYYFSFPLPRSLPLG